MFQDEEEAGLLELLKSQICDNAALYAQKYDEEFQPYLPRFVTAIWNLLVTTGQEVKYDLVSYGFRWLCLCVMPLAVLTYRQTVASSRCHWTDQKDPEFKWFFFFSWSYLCVTFLMGLLLALAASEQCHPVPGIGVREATLQASVWRSEHTHQHLWKGHRPQHGIQKYVLHDWLMWLFALADISVCCLYL